MSDTKKTKKPKAMDLNLWEGDNVIMSKALTTGIHRLDLNGKRIAALAMSQIKQEKTAEMVDQSYCVEISASNYAKIFNLKKSDVYLSMQRGVRDLMKSYVRLNLKETDAKFDKVEIPWVQMVGYAEKEGKVRVEFNRLLTPHITRFINQENGGYALYKIEQAGKLKSVYAWRLFEMISQYRDTGWMTISVDELHRVLEPAKSLRENFGKFRLYCLAPAVLELKEKSKLLVSVEYEQTGRKVTRVKFTFKDDPDYVKEVKAKQEAKSEQKTNAPHVELDYASQLAESREDTARIAKMLEAQKQLTARNNIDYGSANDNTQQPTGFDDFPFDDENDTPEQRLEKMRQHFNQPVIGGRA
jgi:plasmid replication initiation protein